MPEFFRDLRPPPPPPGRPDLMADVRDLGLESSPPAVAGERRFLLGLCRRRPVEVPRPLRLRAVPEVLLPPPDLDLALALVAVGFLAFLPPLSVGQLGGRGWDSSME